MGHCVLEAIAIVKHSSYFKWVPFFLLITSPCRGVASVLLMERERERESEASPGRFQGGVQWGTALATLQLPPTGPFQKKPR